MESKLTYRFYEHHELPHAIIGKLSRDWAESERELEFLDQLVDEYGVWRETIQLVADRDVFTIYFRFRRSAMLFSLSWLPRHVFGVL